MVWSIGALATVQFNQDVQLNVIVVNPCTAETIAFSGTIHLLFGETAPANGGFHILAEDNVQDLKELSTTGTTYSGVGGDWFELNTIPPYPFVATETDVFGLIGQGSTANFKAIATFHITVNADGTLTSTVSDVRITCTG